MRTGRRGRGFFRGRTLGRPLATLGLLLAVPAAQASAQPAGDPAHRLYAAHELHLGGQPLYTELFRQGWPTTRAYRRLTLELGADAADRLMAAHLASGAGLPLSESALQSERFTARIRAGDPVRDVASLVGDELRAFREMTGFGGSVEGLDPVVLPYRRAAPTLVRAWDDGDPRTWRWQPAEERVTTLEGLGFALLAEAAFAREHLAFDRNEPGGARDAAATLGRTPQDGFFALVALQSAAAKVYELRHRLLLDAHEGTIAAPEGGDLFAVGPRRYHYPSAWETRRSDGKLTHHPVELEGSRLQSRLGAQAAALLGVCELAALVGPDAPPTVRALFNERTVAGRKVTLFDPDLHKNAVEVALFLFASIRTLHVSVEGRGRASSLAAPGVRGATVTPTDLGLYLLAIEAFMEKVRVGGDRRLADLAARLEDEQQKAGTLIGSLSGMFLAWRQSQPGFYDAYDVGTNARAGATRSLASQAFAIRGLLATARALPGRPEGTASLQAAGEAVAWLDSEMWSDAVSAYVETDADGVRRTPLLGAAAVLGALRELGLQTGDGRCLLRYRQFRESLEAKGFDRAGAARPAPGLALEVAFGGAE